MQTCTCPGEKLRPDPSARLCALQSGAGGQFLLPVLVGLAVFSASSCGSPKGEASAYQIRCVAFSSDGKYLAAGGGLQPADNSSGGEGAMWVWSVESREQVCMIKNFKTWVTCV